CQVHRNHGCERFPSVTLARVASTLPLSRACRAKGILPGRLSVLRVTKAKKAPLAAGLERRAWRARLRKAAGPVARQGYHSSNVRISASSSESRLVKRAAA